MWMQDPLMTALSVHSSMSGRAERPVTGAALRPHVLRKAGLRWWGQAGLPDLA
jgi:hypothetical protein